MLILSKQINERSLNCWDLIYNNKVQSTLQRNLFIKQTSCATKDLITVHCIGTERNWIRRKFPYKINTQLVIVVTGQRSYPDSSCKLLPVSGCWSLIYAIQTHVCIVLWGHTAYCYYKHMMSRVLCSKDVVNFEERHWKQHDQCKQNILILGNVCEVLDWYRSDQYSWKS